MIWGGRGAAWLGRREPHAQRWRWRGGAAASSLPASRCALSLPKLVFFAWPRGAGGVGSEATSCVRFCCVSPLRLQKLALRFPSRAVLAAAAFFCHFAAFGEKAGEKEWGGVGRPLDVLWRDADGLSWFGVPVPPLLVPSRDAAAGAAPSLAARSSFACTCDLCCSAQGGRRCCTIRDVTVENGSFNCCA